MPNWLGDAVMATPALDNLIRHFGQPEVVLVGSAPVAAMFENDPAFRAVLADTSKSSRLRQWGVYKLASSLRRQHGPFDLAIALPGSLSSKLLLRLAGAKRRVGAERAWHGLLVTDAVQVDPTAHQAEIYNQIINGCLGTNYEAGPTRLYVAQPYRYARRTAGINPGAAYGSAKRWIPERFAEVALRLAEEHDIVIFGAAQEADIAGRIEAALRNRGVGNFENLSGRTSVQELVARIAALDLLVTNDSGPMHIAGAFGVPTVSVFGSTNHFQTSQWRNARSAIVRHDLPCAPCMQRTCPLGHHACMQEITATEVIAAALAL